jgi:hypothetical protein
MEAEFYHKRCGDAGALAPTHEACENYAGVEGVPGEFSGGWGRRAMAFGGDIV